MEKSHQFLKLYNNEFLADVKIKSSNGKQVILTTQESENIEAFFISIFRYTRTDPFCMLCSKATRTSFSTNSKRTTATRI